MQITWYVKSLTRRRRSNPPCFPLSRESKPTGLQICLQVAPLLLFLTNMRALQLKSINIFRKWVLRATCVCFMPSTPSPTAQPCDMKLLFIKISCSSRLKAWFNEYLIIFSSALINFKSRWRISVFGTVKKCSRGLTSERISAVPNTAVDRN